MTIKEFAQKYGLPRTTVFCWIKYGKLPAHKPKGVWYIDDDAIPPEKPAKELVLPKEDIDLKAAFAKRCAYIKKMQRTAVTQNEKRRAYIMRHEADKTIPEIAALLGISSKDVVRIYDEELERMEGVLSN